MRICDSFSRAAGAVALNLGYAVSTAKGAHAHHAGAMHTHYPPWLLMAATGLCVLLGGFVFLWRRNRGLAENNHHLQDRLDKCKTVELKLKQAQISLEAAFEAAKTANEAKRLFLSNMSHELRTPLNGIIGMAGILQKTDLNDEQLDFTNTIVTSSEGLLHIINDILDYANIEVAKLKLESAKFDLAVVIGDVVKFITPMANDKNLGFTHIIDEDVPIYLKGDGRRLQQIVLNLLSNAVKFTHNGGIFLHVSLASEETDDCMLRITVRDTGIGIAPDLLDRLFGSFTQVDSGYTREYGGIGLGLSLARYLVGLMDGELRVESEPGKGSVFWFSVRLSIQKSLPKRKITEQVNEVGGKRILVVDDHQANRQVLEEYLKKWGFSYGVARNAPSALAMLHQAVKDNASFDLAVIDHLMPGMDGVDLGRAIKKDPLLKQTKLVMFTSLEQQEEIAGIQAVGFDAYLAKPIRDAQLFDCLMLLLADDPSPTITNEAPAVMVTREVVQEARESKPRVLVVEDNIINQRVMEKILGVLGCQCQVADNGRVAVEELCKHAFDVVLMDLQMPEMNGFEATTAIRNAENKCLDPRIPIIAVTANAMDRDREKCLDAGMDDFLPKPVHPDVLIEKIRFWCEKRRPDMDIDQPLAN